jgi:hypothetical protein
MAWLLGAVFSRFGSRQPITHDAGVLRALSAGRSFPADVRQDSKSGLGIGAWGLGVSKPVLEPGDRLGARAEIVGPIPSPEHPIPSYRTSASFAHGAAIVQPRGVSNRITYNPHLTTPEALGPIKPPVLETCT